MVTVTSGRGVASVTQLHHLSFCAIMSATAIRDKPSEGDPEGGSNTRAAYYIPISDIAKVHTRLSFIAFFSALTLGCTLHYKKIVKNGIAGYPEEWFPSVSATYVNLLP